MSVAARAAAGAGQPPAPLLARMQSLRAMRQGAPAPCTPAMGLRPLDPQF